VIVNALVSGGAFDEVSCAWIVKVYVPGVVASPTARQCLDSGSSRAPEAGPG
jgi:hypothetical protein